MKTLTTISMALIFGTLTMAAAPALAGSKGQHSSGNSQHHTSNNSNGCQSSCCHKKPCDPSKGKCPPGVIVDPVHQPIVNTIHPILSPPMTIVLSGGATPVKSGGLSGATGVRETTPGHSRGKGNPIVNNPTTPLGEAVQGLGDALGDAFGSIFDPGFTGPPVKN